MLLTLATGHGQARQGLVRWEAPAIPLSMGPARCVTRTLGNMIPAIHQMNIRPTLCLCAIEMTGSQQQSVIYLLVGYIWRQLEGLIAYYLGYLTPSTWLFLQLLQAGT